MDYTLPTCSGSYYETVSRLQPAGNMYGSQLLTIRYSKPLKQQQQLFILTVNVYGFCIGGVPFDTTAASTSVTPMERRQSSNTPAIVAAVFIILVVAVLAAVSVVVVILIVLRRKRKSREDKTTAVRYTSNENNIPIYSGMTKTFVMQVSYQLLEPTQRDTCLVILLVSMLEGQRVSTVLIIMGGTPLMKWNHSNP